MSCVIAMWANWNVKLGVLPLCRWVQLQKAHLHRWIALLLPKRPNISQNSEHHRHSCKNLSRGGWLQLSGFLTRYTLNDWSKVLSPSQAVYILTCKSAIDTPRKVTTSLRSDYGGCTECISPNDLTSSRCVNASASVQCETQLETPDLRPWRFGYEYPHWCMGLFGNVARTRNANVTLVASE